MKNFRKTIYIAIEIKAREFLSQLILSSLALKNNYRIIIGSKDSIIDYILKKPSNGGILLYKGGIHKDTMVKIVVKNKTNPYWFDMYVDRLHKAGALDIQIVEDHLNLNLEDDTDIVDEAEDTLTILRKVVDSIETNVQKKDLDSFLTSLYTEALHQE